MTSATGARGAGAERAGPGHPQLAAPPVTVHVPDLTETVITNILGALLAMLGLIIWVMLRFQGRLIPTPISVGTTVLVMFALITLLAVVAHAGLRAVVMRLMGARPRMGVGYLHGIPYVFATSPGHLFSRAQYIVLAMVPNLVIVPLLYGIATWGSRGGNWILPALTMLSASVGDLWTMGHVVAAPGRVLVEDLREGVALHHQA